MQTNTAQEVKARIDEMLARKDADIAEIETKLNEARELIAEADQAIKEATECTCLEKYEGAKRNKVKYENALEMYSERLGQIRRKKLVNEEESDKVIDSLLEYQNALAAEFERNIIEPLKALDNMQAEYQNALAESQSVILEWTQKIHENYISRSGSTRLDKETGKWTNRMERPVAVRSFNYAGCTASVVVGKFLQNTAIDYFKD